MFDELMHAPTRGLQLLSPKQAQEILDTCRPSWQRPISLAGLAKLRRSVEQSGWLPKSGEIRIYRWPGGLGIGDGQHRLAFIAQGDECRDVDLLVIDCASEEEAAANRHASAAQKPQTAQDRVHSLLHGDAFGLGRDAFKHCQQAVRYLADRLTPQGSLSGASDPVVAAGMQRLAEHFGRLAGVIGECQYELRRKLLSRGCASLFLLVARYGDAALVTRFFADVASGDGALAMAPPRRLREFLLARRAYHGSDARADFIYAAWCFNAFAKGRDTIGKVSTHMPPEIATIGNLDKRLDELVDTWKAQAQAEKGRS